MDNYEKLVGRISKSSGLDVEEIGRRVEAKRAKLSGLVSKEGAAQIVAAELGINFDQERLNLSELVHGMKRANVVGKVIQLFPVREFSKNGREGKVANFIIADDTSNTRVVLWDVNHISLIEGGKIKEGDVIEISNGSVRGEEIHLSSFGDIKQSKEVIEGVVTKKNVEEKKLKDINPGENIKTRAVIVQSFEPRYFEVCPECGKRARENKCAEHGEVKAEKRALLGIVLDDGTETLRGVMFGDDILKLGLTNEDIFSLEKFEQKKSDILGEEKLFSGKVRENQLYNTIELTINGIEEVKPEELIKDLEATQG